MIGYLERATADTFDLNAYLTGVDARLLGDPAGRRALTATDPLLFALLYLPHHMRTEGGGFTFADFHLAVFRHALRWVARPAQPASERDAWMAPRNSGKSTLFFLALPLWAAAHGYIQFVAAFANSGNQAEAHLATFKNELDTNALLREDFPALCEPRRNARGGTLADTKMLIHQKSGFVFSARGIDSGTLGMKVGEHRPDLLLLDDIERDEGSYSEHQAAKRLITLLDAILPLNVFARVVLVGTTTMAGSIVHQLVRTVAEPHAEDLETWPVEEGFRVHHFHPIITRSDGSRRSIWPAKWPLSYLEAIEHTRGFAKNYANLPVSADGDFWGPGDFTYADLATHRELLSIDPATTSKTSSDPYGLAVVGYNRTEKRCAVTYAAGVRLSPAGLRTLVINVLNQHPKVGAVLVETNQGGEVWAALLRPLPVRLLTVHQSEPKDVRAARSLNHYQRGRVLHPHRLPAAEAQMTSYPKGRHDDMVDAIGTGVWWFLDRPASAPSGSSTAYA
ncbi:phage terminase large subunit family protein [Parafrankia discariae]|uniref:phage terminase large subunit family protein n=1 Tax=Parafrankia discariae TaxID=365528 RepID=UPI0003717156|nr:hypothetical protein [Parafrankia discariae]